MKRILTWTLAMMMLVSLLAGCSTGKSSSTSAAQTTAAATTAATSAAASSEAATTAPVSSATSGSTWDTGSIEVEPLGIDLGGVAVIVNDNSISVKVGVKNSLRI